MKILLLVLLPAFAHAQIWQISPLDPDTVEVCQHDKYAIPISIWNNGTTPISDIQVSRPAQNHCPAILFQGSSCLLYLEINTANLGFQQNRTEFTGAVNFYERSDYPVNVKACGPR